MYLDAAGTGPRLNTSTALPGWSVIFWVRLTDSGLQFGGLANDEVHEGADLVGQLVSVRVEHMNGAGFGQQSPNRLTRVPASRSAWTRYRGRQQAPRCARTASAASRISSVRSLGFGE